MGNQQNALPGSLNSLDRASYREDPADSELNRRAVTAINEMPFGADSFTVDKTDPLSDVYTYLVGATPVGTITVEYADECKQEIIGGGRAAI